VHGSAKWTSSCRTAIICSSLYLLKNCWKFINYRFICFFIFPTFFYCYKLSDLGHNCHSSNSFTNGKNWQNKWYQRPYILYCKGDTVECQDVWTQCNNSAAFTPYCLLAAEIVRLTESTLNVKCFLCYKIFVSNTSCSETQAGFQPVSIIAPF
jgi:hypothetical protein